MSEAAQKSETGLTIKGGGKRPIVSIADDFEMAVVQGRGFKVEMAADGSVIVYTDGSVKVKPAPANDSAAKNKAALQIGDPDDGGIYVGLSAENGKPLHAALADLPEYKTYEEAIEAAAQLKSLHPTAHVPTPKELNQNLYVNKDKGALAGTFNTSGADYSSNPASAYRSSALYYDYNARVQSFEDGYQFNLNRHNRLPVRLVW